MTSKNKDGEAPKAIRWARRAGQISMGLAVGALLVVAVLEVQNGRASVGFVYEGF